MPKRVFAAGIVVGGAAAALLLGPNGPLGGFWAARGRTEPPGVRRPAVARGVTTVGS